MHTMETVSSLTAWQEQAACKAAPLGIFYCDNLSDKNPLRGQLEQIAKYICSTCPVINECLQHAMLLPEREGVWGGLTAKERERRRRNASRVAGATRLVMTRGATDEQTSAGRTAS
jgi:WhiB family redox-sensing transcriptional regulator